jgi:hypothetical protein
MAVVVIDLALRLVEVGGKGGAVVGARAEDGDEIDAGMDVGC